MAVVRSGVVAFVHWGKCGYVNSDGVIDHEYYWHRWQQRQTVLFGHAKRILEDIEVDAEFYKTGIYIYLKILGYGKQTDWLREVIAARVDEKNQATRGSGD